jgi:hypothetical protein
MLAHKVLAHQYALRRAVYQQVVERLQASW